MKYSAAIRSVYSGFRSTACIASLAQEPRFDTPAIFRTKIRTTGINISRTFHIKGRLSIYAESMMRKTQPGRKVIHSVLSVKPAEFTVSYHQIPSP